MSLTLEVLVKIINDPVMQAPRGRDAGVSLSDTATEDSQVRPR
jgi:hypothetical protein